MSDLFQRQRAARTNNRRRVNQTLSIPPVVSVLAVLGVVALLIVMFPLEWFRKPKVIINADQSLFSPNFDGNFDQITIYYTISEESEINIFAVNSLGQTARALLTNVSQTPGQHTLTWDGRDNGGNVVPDGNYTITLESASSFQKATGSVVVSVDNTPPPLVIANFPAAQTVKSDKIEIEGSTAPDAILQVNNEPSPVSVTSNGVFHITRQLVEGNNVIVIRASDAAGNHTEARSEIIVRSAPPTLNLTGPTADTWFNTTIVPVTGFAPADARVTINGREAQIGPDGFFNLEIVLQDGDNVIRVVATDPVGNTSTEERIVHVRAHGPTITLANLPDGLSVAESTLRVVGKVDPGSSVTINGNASPTDAQGNFSTTLALQPGQNVVTFVSTDQAGNTTNLTRLVTYSVEEPSTFILPEVSGNDLLPRLALGGAALAVGGLIAAFYLRRPTSLKLEINKNTFYPNHPGDDSFVGLRVTLSRSARVTLRIRDQMDREIMTLVNNRNYTAGQHLRLWNGRTSRGSVLASGIYQVEATAATLFGGAINSAVWVQLDSSFPMVGAAPAAATGAESTTRRSFADDDDEQVIDVS